MKIDVKKAEVVSRVMRRQREFFDAGETRDPGMRIAALRRLDKALSERREEMLEALVQDMGKPEIEAFLAEHAFLMQEIRLLCRSLKKWLAPRRVGSPFYFQPCTSEVCREPFGMALLLAPWNYPMQLSLAPLLAAVAAGNTVVLKPSEMAPACERFLASIIADCFPPEHVAVVCGGVDVATELLDRKFDFIFFTGSTEIGRVVAGKAARHLTPTILELGGKCPCVVHRSADLELTARRILAGKFFNAGQTCFAPDFVVAHEEIREALVDELERLLERLPWEKEMATIINERHYQRLLDLLGGREIRKGEDDRGRLHLAPRILPEADWGDRAMREEIFGPVLPVVGLKNTGELIDRLKGYASPLALYVFTRDEEFVAAVMAGIRSGSVCVNDTMKQASNLNLPFGGVGDSGHGRYRGRAGVESFSYERSVTKRYFLKDWFEMLPPRAGKTAFLKRWLK